MCLLPTQSLSYLVKMDTVFMLKTVGADDACIFLKDNRCTIHSVHPRACRTYPIAVGHMNLAV
ncbi:MAG: YkgJ family cysteine cluster protein [Hydrogeniiclostridium mannosilyticum]